MKALIDLVSVALAVDTSAACIDETCTVPGCCETAPDRHDWSPTENADLSSINAFG